MGQFGLGQGLRRIEDQRLLTGQGRYTDDIRLDGEAVGYVHRSPYAHAEIRHIDTAAAREAPGVLGVYTAADLGADGIGDIQCQTPMTGKRRQQVDHADPPGSGPGPGAPRGRSGRVRGRRDPGTGERRGRADRG